jgi:hypothetical protein
MRETPTIIASIGGEDAGFLTLLRHKQYSAEIYVMGVLPAHHVGAMLCSHD